MTRKKWTLTNQENVLSFCNGTRPDRINSTTRYYGVPKTGVLQAECSLHLLGLFSFNH